MKRPTVEEINEYMEEKEFFDYEQAEIFFDHFESKGWMVGKSKMKCWKAATRNWIRNAKKWSKNGTRQSNYQQLSTTERTTQENRESYERTQREIAELESQINDEKAMGSVQQGAWIELQNPIREH
jgi:hypothetical protein